MRREAKLAFGELALVGGDWVVDELTPLSSAPENLSLVRNAVGVAGDKQQGCSDRL